MVGVVVCQEDGGDGKGVGGEVGGEVGRPGREALACVEEETRGAMTNKVGVCSLEREL